MGPRIVGIDFQCPTVGRNRIFDLALSFQDIAQIRVAPGVLWVDPHRPAVVPCRLIQQMLPIESIAQCGIPNCRSRPARQCRTIITPCLHRCGLEQSIAKNQVCPEIGGMLSLHPFQNRRRIATDGPQPLAKRQEQRDRRLAHRHRSGQVVQRRPVFP